MVVAGLVAPIAAVAGDGTVALAAAPAVVINEINYNPASGNPFDEYLEFHNTTGSPIDLGGWEVGGISYTIPSGVVAPAGGFAVIGGAMFGAFGALSNGGERIRLIDPSGNVVDSVTYDDQGEWPALADGEGQSLQRRDPAAPSDDPGNWVSDAPSPGAPNPLAGAGVLPSFADVEHTVLPAAGAPITVTATLSGASSAQLAYRIGFGPEQSIVMSVAGGTATAVIPGQPAGSLVRYRLAAQEGDRVGTWPRQGDGAAYRGTTVAEPAASGLPTFDIFMPDDVYAAMAADLTLGGDDGYPMVFAFEGEVYDNTKIRVKGQVSRFFPKKKFKIILAPGYEIDDDRFPEAIDEFAIHSSWVDRSFLRETLVSELLTAADVRATQQAFPVRIERNGAFFGLYTYIEQPDGSWRDRSGLDDSEVYEVSPDNLWGVLDPIDVGRSQDNLRARYDKETFEYTGDDRLREFIQIVNGLSGPAEREWILANVDVPSVVNALATSMVIQHQDWGFKNYRLIFDQYGFTGVAQNDYDLSLGRRWSATLGGLDSRVYVGGAFEHPGGPFFLTFFTDPILSEMVRRRIRTVAEEILVPDAVAARTQELAAQVRADAVLDRAVWGTYGGSADPTAEANRIIDSFVVPQHARLLGTLAAQGRVAATSQPAIPAVSITGVAYDGLEHVVMRNNSGDSVDLSGFTIPELDLELLGGTVLLPGQEAIVIHEDAGWVAGAFPGRIRAGYFGDSVVDASDGLTLRNRAGDVVAGWDLLTPGTTSEVAGQADRSALVSLVATQTAGPGFLQLLDCSDDAGATSNLNLDGAGQTRSVLALAEFAADGSACIFNSGATHVVADLQGYFAPGAVDDVADERLLDTRSGARPAAGTTVTITGGRPDATGIVNLVATDTAAPGFVSVVQCGATAPTTSNVNVDAPGKTVAALAFVRFDATGSACLFTSADAHLVADVQGYLDAGAFDDVADARLLDTRTDGTPLTQQVVTLRGRPGSTAIVSLVATEATAPGFLQALPCDAAPGATSNVNIDRPGATVAALAAVAFGADGTACVFASSPTRIVADLQGYFTAGAFDDIADVRLIDSRQR